MQAPSKKFESVKEYFAAFPPGTRRILKNMQKIIRASVPSGVEEVISYNMPAFRLNGVLVWYAAYQKHIGFYPSSSGIEAFKEELSEYKNSKGAVQFPLDHPLPVDLISRMVKYRVDCDLEKAKEKKKKK